MWTNTDFSNEHIKQKTKKFTQYETKAVIL